MVFFLVAVPLAEGQNEAHTKQVLETNCIQPSGKVVGEMNEIKVRSLTFITYIPQIDKSRFKIGTLDSLMEMNESLQKLDQQLDAAVKKIEKQSKDLGVDELKIETSEGKSKCYEATHEYLR